MVRFVANLTWAAIALLLLVHVAFGDASHSMLVRVLTAVPGVILLLEARRHIRLNLAELPILLVGLTQYYATFSFGVFFDIPFYEVDGRVDFTEAARNSGAVAVALGSVFLWTGAYLGRRTSAPIRSLWIKALPPAEQPAGFPIAFAAYALAAVALAVFTTFYPYGIPLEWGQLVLQLLALEFVFGLSLTLPRSGTGLLRHATDLVYGLGCALPLLKGQLEPIFRFTLARQAAHWAFARRFSVALLIVVAGAYVVLQPAKAAFRERTWNRDEVSFSARMDAWGAALSNRFAEKSRQSARDDTGTEARLSELGAVMHAFDMVPNKVPMRNGEGFLAIAFSPIPRLLWPGKPTTEAVQRFGVIFHRQTERGSRSTALLLPLLVEGYWNLGWPGIVLATTAMGYWLGVSQSAFSGEHWALRAIAVGQVFLISAAGPIAYTFGSLFQISVGRIVSSWAVYLLAKAISSQDRRRKVRFASSGRGITSQALPTAKARS